MPALPTATVRTAVDVPAPRSAVWAVLADGPSHASWNPFVRRLDGTLAPGGRLEVVVQPSGSRPMRFRPVVRVVEEGRRLAWLGRCGVPGLLDGLHSWTLEDLPGGGTRVVQAEEFRGLLVPLVRRTLARTEAGFRAMDAALAQRVVAGAHAA